MNTVVVLLGADSPVVRAVSAALQDWSAVGLVRNHVWVEEADVRSLGQDLTVPATIVRSGIRRDVRLLEHIADERGLRRLRVCAISVVGGRTQVIGNGPADVLLNGLRRLGPVVTPMHCLVARHGGKGWEPTAGMMQWHNVLVAPEDAWDPASSPAPMDTSGDDAAFVAHAAAAVAGVAGLWTGVDEAPLDSELAGGDVVTPVRCFMRRLDASEVAGALRTRLTDVTRALPRPLTARGQLPYFNTPSAACTEMAGRVFARHAGLFAPTRPARAEITAPQEIGALAALKLFGAFLVAALRDVPRLWLKKMLAVAADAMQQGIFGGQESQYQVVVHGVTASGAPAGPSEVADAADSLGVGIQDPVESRVRDADRFWQDVVAGALTLGDGQGRALDPVFVDDQPGVVPHADHIAPDPSQRFVLPARLSAHLDVSELRPWDVPAAYTLRSALAALASEGGPFALAAGQTLEDLNQWWGARRRSYLTGVGTQLYRNFTAAVAQLAEVLRASSQTPPPPGLLDGAMAASRLVRRIAALLGIVLAGIVTCSAVGLLSPVVAVAAAGGAVLLAGLSAFVVFYRGQKELFHYLTAAQEAARRNGPYEITALARIVRTAATLLSQYDCWAPVMGRFAREPYGVPERHSVAPVRLAGTLPRAMGLGVVRPVEDDMAIAAAELTEELFEPGWLGVQWQRLLAGAPERLRPDGVAQLRGNPEVLYTDPGSGPGSLLRRWSGDVAAEGVGADADAELWASARRSLRGRGWAKLAGDLFTSIEVATWPRRDGRDTQGDAVTFLRELLTTSERSGRPDQFNADLFRPEIGDFQPHLVARSVVVVAGDLHSGLVGAPGRTPVRVVEPERAAGDGLDQFVLMIQSAAARPARLISIRRDGPVPVPGIGPGEPPREPEWLV